MSEFDIFEAAKQISDPAERAAYLDRECGDDLVRRADVEKLLRAADQEHDGFLDDETFVQTDFTLAPADTINGRYKLIQQIGEGGMGAVFMAEDFKDIRRKVAIKIIKSELNSPGALARFEAERQALAMMEHDNIAKLFDAGQIERDGAGHAMRRELFFVMELVKGIPIHKYCDEHRLTVDERIRLFIQVCRAVQHAHHKGIIHRDLKPGNILVAEYDGDPQVKVIDFGLAKALGEPLTDKSLHTMFGQVLGTIQYMSPEQATLNQLDIDTQSDIYSLAVVLYELLTGSTPHAKEELAGAAFDAMLRMIRETEPVRASQRLSSSSTLPSLAAYRQTEPKRLSRLLRGELDLVLMKGLEKQRTRRYRHADEFAADLERFLNREPVSVVPPSLSYRCSKYLRKRWKAAVGAGLLLVTAILGIAGFIWQEFRRQDLKKTNVVNHLRATLAEAQLTSTTARAELAESERERQRERAESAAREAATGEFVGLMGKIAREESQRSPGWAERSWQMLQRALTLQTPLRETADWRSAAAAVLLADEFHALPDWTFSEGALSMAYSQSGKLLALALYGDTLKPQPRIVFLDAEAGKVVRSFSQSDNVPPPDLLRQHPIAALRSHFRVCRFALSDRYLFGWTQWGRLCRWDLAVEPPEVAVHNFGARSEWKGCTRNGRFHFVFDAESKQLVEWDLLEFVAREDPIDLTDSKFHWISMIDDQSAVLHIESGTAESRLLRCLPFGAIRSFPQYRGNGIFHPSGQFFVARQQDGRCGFSWPDLTNLHSYAVLSRNAAEQNSNAASAEILLDHKFSPSGRSFGVPVFTERSTDIAVLDANGGPVRQRIAATTGDALKHEAFVFSPQDDRLSINTRSIVKQFSRLHPRLSMTSTLGHPSGVRYVRRSPEYRELAVVGERRRDGKDSIVVWKIGNSPSELHSRFVAEIGSIPKLATNILSYSPDGRWLVSAGRTAVDAVRIDIRDRLPQGSVRGVTILDEQRLLGKAPLVAEAIAGFAWTDSGELIAAIDCDIFVWKIEGDKEPTLVGRQVSAEVFGRPEKYVSVVSAIGRSFWGLTFSGQVRYGHLAGPKMQIARSWSSPGEADARICQLSPDKRWLAIGKSDGSAVLFDTSTESFGAVQTAGHSGALQAMCWLDQHRLITGGTDGSLTLWRIDEHGDANLWYRMELNAPVSDIAATPDDRGVYVACSDETSLRVIDLQTIDDALAELIDPTPAMGMTH